MCTLNTFQSHELVLKKILNKKLNVKKFNEIEERKKKFDAFILLL